MKLLPWDYALRNLGRSPLRTILSVSGCALVILLVLTAAGFVRGMNQTLTLSGNERNVYVLGQGSEESIERSEISTLIPGLLTGNVAAIRQRFGAYYCSPEVHLATLVATEKGGTNAVLANLRGVTEGAYLVHNQVRVTAGRIPQPGHEELLAGRLAAVRMGLPAQALAIGQRIWFDGRPWTITGHFEAPGTVMEAELWCPLIELQLAAKRENLSCVAITLNEADDFGLVDLYCKQRLDLELIAIRETDYYALLSDFYRPIRMMVWATAVLVALGGLLGGLNTMYAAFAARIRELATLQALGFSRLSILTSIIQESLLSAAAGTLVALSVALLLLDGYSIRISMGAFGLSIDTVAILSGCFVGLGLGILGALPPVLRCLRPQIPDALKAA